MLPIPNLTLAEDAGVLLNSLIKIDRQDKTFIIIIFTRLVQFYGTQSAKKASRGAPN